ncbi:MAG TPA: glycosyltransferase family 4 protein [Candidatus Deferrimicrobium sp.]|nr:glycosyltransferase family 4 protein [Candidatus Deferrimicrobium sp.]
MNFLFILNTFYPNIGGVENATFEICKRLRKRSHNVYVLTTTKSNFFPQQKELLDFEIIDEIQIFRVRYSLRMFGFPLGAIMLVKKLRINYIYITDFWGSIALFCKRVFRIPFVYILNGYNPICPTGMLFHDQLCNGFEIMKCIKNCHQFSLRFLLTLSFTRVLLREAKRVFAISKAVRNAYLSFFGQIPIKLNYYGIDSQKFRPLQVQFFKIPYNLKESDKIILFFGRLIKYRGVADFIVYFKEITKQVNCKLLIVGLGSDLPEIKNKVRMLKLQESVVFAGILRDQELIDVINFSQLIILPILFPEPLSLVVLESMACAKPVVSFELGGVKDLLNNMKTGVLVPPNDWSQFIRRILQLLKDDKLREAIGLAARRKVEKMFNWDRFIEQFLKEIN